MIPVATWAQVDSVATDSLAVNAVPDTVATTQPDTLQSDSVTVLFKVRPWDYHAPLHSEVSATDSTLRWQLLPSWSYKKNRDPGVISYRMGTIGRTNTQQNYAHAPIDQQLFWENIRLNDPVSGMVNWNYIPNHKINTIYEDNLGTAHRTTFYLQEFHLNEPLTQLNYTESSFNTRSLEFMVSNNFGQKTNAELSYWDRRDGGEFNNSEVTGRQIYARVSHQLDARQALKLKFLNNNYDNDLPFGYVIPNLETYNFDRFQTTAREPSGQGTRSSTIIGANYYRRPADSLNNTSNLHAGVFMNTTKREVEYSADTTAYDVRTLGANVQRWQGLGPLDIESAASFEYFIPRAASSSLQTDNWSLFTSELKAQWQPFQLVQINGHGNYRRRSDGFNDYRLGGTVSLLVSNWFDIRAGYTTGKRMPTPQQLYWQADQFRGNANLETEEINEYHASLDARLIPGMRLGAKTQLKQLSNNVMMGADSVFTNVDDYSSLAASVQLDYESRHFEFSTSANMQQFGSFLNESTEPLPVDETQRIWFKGGAYLKGYLFDRATYVKAGVSGILAPQAYFPAQYYPSLDYWQISGDTQVPAFNRLDVDLSARVRSIMVLLRYENVLDDIGQQGYFETAGYPMTGGRFLFGIRVRFRN